ncbi:MAG: DUF2851 family protein [Lentisphaeria bacterium]|nr:DUF2851 family protein [Lentisphaeria bacterium]
MQTENENKMESFILRDPSPMYESVLQSHWDNLSDGVILTDTEGRKIEIISRGEWNHEAGPDFRNAKIRYLGKIVRGDIELHRRSSDYIRHGHLADAAYSNVILHVVEGNDWEGGAEGKTPADIPVCCLAPEILERQSGSICRCRIFPYMAPDILCRFFTDAGQERIQEKSSVILETLIKSGTGAAFRQALFRAAGYKRNQDVFLELLKRLEQYPLEVFQEHFEALLWGESSLLPDPAKADLPEEVRKYIRGLWDEFWSFRLTAVEPLHWNRDSVRPLNSPERRIAMLTVFLRKFTIDPLPSLAEKFSRSHPGAFVKELRKELNLSDPFWDRHCSFYAETLERKNAVLGADRAETLLIDVIVPSLLAYSKLHGGLLPESKAALLPLQIHALKDNRVFKNAMRRWLPEHDPRIESFDNSAMVQGCLHVYKKYCAETAGDCASCLLANSLL